MNERRRRENAKGRVLRALQDDRRVSNLSLNKLSHRYSARIHELRSEGHRIEINPLGQGVFEYIYKGFDPPPLDHEQIQLFNNRPRDD